MLIFFQRDIYQLDVEEESIELLNSPILSPEAHSGTDTDTLLVTPSTSKSSSRASTINKDSLPRAKKKNWL